MDAVKKIDIESCGCGCGHDHDHEHHNHDHDHHDHVHSHECGHDHDHHHDHDHGCCEEHSAIKSEPIDFQTRKGQKVYILENLGCANCAAKMERKIQELPEVSAATITYATKQLKIAAESNDELLPKLQAICSAIEDGVQVVPREKEKTKKKQNKSIWKDNKKDLLCIAGGALLFIAGKAAGDLPIIFVAAYILLGLEIVWAALKNLAKGRLFDENFLMSVATLAAFCIGDFAEATAIVLFYRVGEFFEHIAVERSRSQIMEAVDMRPEVVNLVDENQIKVVPAEDVNPGDTVLVRPGDRIPLDGIVVEGESRVDTSPVTGEPVPVVVKAGSALISGCVNEQGVLKMKVEKALSESMVTRILDSVENAAASKPKLDRFITKFARIYTPIVVFAALATAVIPSLVTGDWEYWLKTAITFLVISCPCALVLSVPLAFFSGIGAGSKRGILFKGGVAIEALKNVKAVVMDKTGTITKGEFRVQNVVGLGHLTTEQVLGLAAACEAHSTHPIGTSIITAAKEKNIEMVNPDSVEEISGKGIKAVISGSVALCGNKALMEYYQIDVSPYKNQQYGTEVLIALDGKLEGYLLISDTIKEDAKLSVMAMKKQNLTTAMLTGDALESAEAVAKEAGIDEVHAKLLPQDKLDHLQQIRQKYGAVLFVGDGINDAPVLAGADVGAAMGSGADAAIEAADVVYMTSSVGAVSESIQIAKNTGKIAMQNIVIALLVKALVLMLGFAGYASIWMAVFADTGVAMICVLNSIRVLYKKYA